MKKENQKICIRNPKNDNEFEKYYSLQYTLLRQPWGQPRRVEKIQNERYCHHLAAFDENLQILAVGYITPIDAKSPLHWKIRQMAVDKLHQKQGIGNLIIHHLELYAASQGAITIFLDARSEALDFYLKNNYTINGPGKILYKTIKHFKLSKKIDQCRD